MNLTGVHGSTVVVGIFTYQSNLLIILVPLCCKDTTVLYSVSEVATWGGYGLYDKECQKVNSKKVKKEM